MVYRSVMLVIHWQNELIKILFHSINALFYSTDKLDELTGPVFGIQ